MDRKLLILGGTVLVAGSLAYWYLSQQQNGNDKTCGDYNTKTECQNAGCYWWTTGVCRSYPEPSQGCQGECFYEGQKDCDIYGNLCKCINGNWTLFESNSNLCKNPIYHNACFPSTNGIITCIPVIGISQDTCYNLGFSTGCNCQQYLCDEYHICVQDKRCIKRATNITISATTNNMICWDESMAWNQVRSHCKYTLNEEYAATRIDGDLYYKWGPYWPGDDLYWAIYGHYKGTKTLLSSGSIWSSSTTGKITIASSFEEQGVDELEFTIDSGNEPLSSNVHIDKFIGKLNY